jgi:protein-tyrosine-phosphatase
MNKKNILFVCVENSNRSQMAQAFAAMHGGSSLNTFSAGSRPSGKINPRAVAAMNDVGYDLSKHQSKSLEEIPDAEYEYAITMGCGDECPYVPGKRYIDWELPDPAGRPPAAVRAIRDEISARVQDLVAELTTTPA